MVTGMSIPFPPFQPDPPDGTRPVRTFRGIPLRMLAPSMITLLALCSGLTSIRMSFEDRIDVAIAAIAFAALLDALDGRVARMLKSTSRFGAELDSLADFVNFGVAPAILLYAWLLDMLGSLGWLGGLLFALCSALRLARFNVQLDSRDRPAWMGNFFVGVPAPAGAMVLLLPVYLSLIGMPRLEAGALIVLAYQCLIAFLMVSRLPTFSGKRFGERIPREMVLPVFVAVVMFFALLASFPWSTLAIGSIAYLVALPISLLAFRRLEKRHAASERKAKEQPVAEAPASEIAET